MAGSSGTTSGAATALLPPVKSVVVYRNGDPFYCGRRFVVNQRQVATMEAFLNDVTQSIGASLAIRSLYTPRQGHRVSDFQDLHTGGHYVAAGFERFKKLDYLNTASKKQPVAREGTQARIIQRPNVSAKWRKFIPVPCIIHVFRNGDLLWPPLRFILPRSMQQDLDQILSMVTEKISLRTGAVRRLCTLEGATVSMAEELETGHCYVAVGTERFRKLPYVELFVSKAQRNYQGNKRVAKRNEAMKTANGPEDRFSDSALLDSPVPPLKQQADGRRVKSSGDDAAETGAPQQANQRRAIREGREEGSVFHPRPARTRRNRGQPRVPVSNGGDQTGMYKRAARKRREEVCGAQEVQEDENTVTELPVDQRVAEAVEDEEQTHGNGSPRDMEKQIDGKTRTREGSSENIRPSTPPKRDSGILCENETQLFQRHPELLKNEINNVQEAQLYKYNGCQEDLRPEPTVTISTSGASSSPVLSLKGSRAVPEKNGALEGDRSRPHSSSSPKVPLPNSTTVIIEQNSCREGPVTDENGDCVKQITT